MRGSVSGGRGLEGARVRGTIGAVAWVARVERQEPVLVIDLEDRRVVKDREREQRRERPGLATELVRRAHPDSLRAAQAERLELDRHLARVLGEQIAPVSAAVR